MVPAPLVLTLSKDKLKRLSRIRLEQPPFRPAVIARTGRSRAAAISDRSLLSGGNATSADLFIPANGEALMKAHKFGERCHNLSVESLRTSGLEALCD